MNNKNSINVIQGVFRACLSLLLLSGASSLMAQDAAGGKQASEKAKKSAPVYEMKEVSGHIYD
ncbi:MAG: hypothetical protein IJ729_07510, partial [Alloprevotella sp.]|nr:hypothetical protein [Alloprevotella sp.]